MNQRPLRLLRLIPDTVLVAGILDGVPLFDTGEALLLGDAILLPARIKLKFPAIEPLSQTRNFWEEWESEPRIQQQFRSDRNITPSIPHS
jgi:hypothetical protein